MHTQQWDDRVGGMQCASFTVAIHFNVQKAKDHQNHYEFGIAIRVTAT